MRMPIEPIAKVEQVRFREWLDCDESSRTFISRSVPSCSGTRNLFQQLCTMAEGGDFLAWAQRTKEGKVIAYAELKQSAKVTRSELELIYVVSEAYRGKGIATSLVREILDLRARDDDRDIVAYVNPTNVASLKVLRRNRFIEVPSSSGGVRYERGAHNNSINCAAPTAPDAACGRAGYLRR